ncbi:MAG: sigma 54-interacting transcriptional regulator [Desulfobulbaceae bacterium]|nr:sigma 54-interacting transcriptional regulator [Desulfobulbaceae bacterium]
MIKDENFSKIISNLHRLTADIFDDAIQRKLILDNLCEGVFTVDPDLRITSFNKAAEQITGIKESDVLGKLCVEICETSHNKHFCLIAEAIGQKKSIRKRIRHVSVNGTWIPILVSASPLWDQSGYFVGGIQSFQEISDFFRSHLILDSIFDGVFTVDLDFRITFFNAAAEQLTGMLRRDVIGKKVGEVFRIKGSSPDLNFNSPLIRAVRSGEYSKEDSVFLEIGEGGVLPVSLSAAPLFDARGNIIGGVENFRDNTDRIQAEIVLNSVADGVLTVDKNFIITSFNTAAERITGYGRHEVLGRKCRDVFHSSVCKDGCPLAKALNLNEKVLVSEVLLCGKNNNAIPVSVSSTVLVDQDNNIIGGVETFRDLTEITSLRQRLLQSEDNVNGIISRSPKMRKILAVLPHFAQSESTILILGESGTGKELIAKAIHELSPRKSQPFVAVNSGALPDSLLESELFGYKAGAFTDARKDRKGRFAAAEKGTLFLDEIGDISSAMQVKLLRVLQSKSYEPLGVNESVHTDVRVIAATNKDLDKMVKQNIFREDLYYRLNVVKVELPPLRERMEDVPLLTEHFIQRFNAQKNKKISGISDEALSLLMHHDYPGNIRELENIIEYAFILCRGELILPQHLPDTFNYSSDASTDYTTKLTLAELEKKAIIEALSRNNFKKMKTCRELGISKDTLRRKLTFYGYVI